MRYLVMTILVAASLVLVTGARGEEAGGQERQPALGESIQDLYGDDAFVSIATGSSKPVYRAPSVATVITAAEIKAMGARDLNDVLETVPGLHVSLSTLNRLDSVYSIRGIHTGFNPQVLLLMNGVPFTNLFNGGRPFLFRLPVASIARVEVIRGPGSAVYGADAFAGVINVITKDAEDIDGTESGVRAGSFDTYDAWLQHGRKWGGWDVAFSLEWEKSEGDDDRRVGADLQTMLDQVFGTSASLAPGSLSTHFNVLDTHLELKRGDWRLRNWYWRQDDAGQGAGGAQAIDPKGEQDEDLFLADITYQTENLWPDWDFSVNLNYLYCKTDSRFVLLPPGTVVPIGSDGNLNFTSPAGVVLFPGGLLGNPGGKERQTGIDLATIYNGLLGHRLRIATGYKYQKATTTESKNFGPGVIDGSQPVVPGTLTSVTNTQFIFLPDSSRTLWYLSLQDEWQFARDWELTAGARYDHYSDFGSTVNPRLALVWATGHNLTTKFLYGRAFRAPAFSEQFAINNPVVLGNRNLDPETIDTFEVAFDYRPTFDLQTSLSLFTYQAEDMIDFVPDPGGTTATAQNARDQEGYGFELEMKWEVVDDLQLYGNYAWQHSEDKKTNQRIADAPGQKLYLGADWRFLPGWGFSPQLTWVGDRRRAESDPRPSIDDYLLVDLSLRRQGIMEHWDIAVGARNLFDEDAREPSNGVIPGDYPLEGRSFWGEVRYRF